MKRKGKNMKKALGILSVLVLITVMLISCNAEQNVNDTVEVSFNVSSSRALTVENDDFISVNSDKLTWYYHGVKKTDTEFKTGQSGTGDDYWTPISTGDRLSATSVEFSQGQWYFEVKAINDAGIQMYYGKTNGNVLLTKENTTISISVSPFVSGVKGTLVLNGVYIEPADGNPSKVAPNRLFINGVPRNISISNGATSLSYTEQVEPGTYTVEVQRVGEEDTGVVLASASKTVVVYSGLTTTIEGSVEEDTTTGTFVPQPTKPEGTETVTVPQSGNLIVVFANVTPSMEVDKSTTVTVPYSAISGYAGKSVELKIAVKNYTSINEKDFAVSDGNGVAASISLTMKSGETPITYFNGEKVTVETYIETGLSGVTVKYKGTDAQPSDIVYVPATGMLTFSTTHFSEFYVESDKQAGIGDKGYVTLQAAVDAAKGGDTITLLKNVQLTSQVDITKEIKLDMNGKTISYVGSSMLGKGVIHVKDGGDLTVYGNGSIEAGENCYAAITVYGNGDDTPEKLTIENGSFKGLYYPISGNGTKHNTEITINGGTFSSTDGLCIYHPQDGTLTINGGSFEGQESAIEIRSGNLTINDGTFKATNTLASSTPNGNGTTSNGVAIAVAQHTTKKPINVTIKGGKFEGYSAFYESNPQNNSADDIAKVNLVITGGTFNAINGGTCAVYSQDKKGFITGGTFSTDPSDYVPFGYDVVETADGYVVSTSTELTVNDADQLMKFAASVNAGNDYAGKTITLKSDINLTGKTWVPIGEGNRSDRQHVFKGKFDGNNHTIRNLSSNGYDPSTIANKGLYAYGLFGIVEGATIQNVKFENISIDTVITVNDTTYKGDSVGAVVGYAFKNATITGCELKSGSISGHDAVAGIIGRAYGDNKESDKFEISNCKNYATIQATKGKVAGVIGITGNLDNSRYSSIIQNCENRGTIKGNEAGTAGIIAYVTKNTTINSCHNYGVIGSSNDQYSGGIGGYVTGSNIEFVDCNNYATGTITASLDAGGIVGISTNISNIKNCENSGSICAGDNGHAGGIAGSTKFSNVKDCKNTATVHGMYSGGIIGVDGASTITNSTGGSAAITSPAHTIGYNTNNHYQLEVAANKSSGRLIGGLGGDGQNAFTKLTISANESDEKLPAVGICGIYTTWSNLEITGGNFYGEPLAGNTSYIILTQAGSWGSRVAGTYSNGGLDENSRKTNWTLTK